LSSKRDWFLGTHLSNTSSPVVSGVVSCNLYAVSYHHGTNFVRPARWRLVPHTLGNYFYYLSSGHDLTVHPQLKVLPSDGATGVVDRPLPMHVLYGDTVLPFFTFSRLSVPLKGTLGVGVEASLSPKRAAWRALWLSARRSLAAVFSSRRKGNTFGKTLRGAPRPSRKSL